MARYRPASECVWDRDAEWPWFADSSNTAGCGCCQRRSCDRNRDTPEHTLAAARDCTVVAVRQSGMMRYTANCTAHPINTSRRSRSLRIHALSALSCVALQFGNSPVVLKSSAPVPPFSARLRSPTVRCQLRFPRRSPAPHRCHELGALHRAQPIGAAAVTAGWPPPAARLHAVVGQPYPGRPRRPGSWPGVGAPPRP
jgi:hypothetical protein